MSVVPCPLGSGPVGKEPEEDINTPEPLLLNLTPHPHIPNQSERASATSAGAAELNQLKKLSDSTFPEQDKVVLRLFSEPPSFSL